MALFIASDQVGGWKTAEKSKKKKKENKKKRIRIDRFFHTHTHKKKKKNRLYVRSHPAANAAARALEEYIYGLPLGHEETARYRCSHNNNNETLFLCDE
jgi:hypothetical protein